jgi:hypothetical protein
MKLTTKTYLRFERREQRANERRITANESRNIEGLHAYIRKIELFGELLECFDGTQVARDLLLNGMDFLDLGPAKI